MEQYIRSKTMIVSCLLGLQLLLSAHWSLALGGGSYVGNGGDTLLCQPSELNPFAGYYTLDYLLEYKTSSYSIEAIHSFEDTKTRLSEVFLRHYPEIYSHFKDFVDQIEKQGPGANRQWIPSETGLSDLKDEDILKEIPENCLREEEGKAVPDLLQTVIRQAFYSPLRYLYNKDILTQQRQRQPLQYSFFMIHEWLWDLTQDVRIIRKLNWLFHSRELESLNRRDFVHMFSNFELFLSPLPLCSRSQPVKDKYPKVCEELELAELRAVTHLEFDGLAGPFLFRFGDFSGFGRVTEFTISNSLGVSDKLYPRIFYPFFSLASLNLTGNDLTSLSSEVTRDLGELEELDLRGNPIEKIGSSFLALKALKVLKLSLGDKLFSEHQDYLHLPGNLELLVLQSSDEKRLREVKTRLANLRPELNLQVLP